MIDRNNEPSFDEIIKQCEDSGGPILECSPNTWIYGSWICGDSKAGDWMGSLFRRVHDDENLWKFNYRFRDYVDNKVYGSEDPKRVTFREFLARDRAEFNHALKGIWLTAKMIANHRWDNPCELHFIDLQCKGDDPKVLEKLESMPFLHAKTRDDETS